MKLILFSKMLKEKSVEELADLAVELGIDGYDLCVRPDYPVNPDNAATALPQAARTLAQQGRVILWTSARVGLWPCWRRWKQSARPSPCSREHFC